MNILPFKQDIDELIEEFVKGGLTRLADWKRIWVSRKFSYVFEANPKTKHGFFMQSLYAHSISHMVSSDSFSRRVGGELKRLKSLVVEAKEQGVQVVLVLIKRMIEKNLFLFGFVDLNEGSKIVNQFTTLQDARLKIAYEKLFGDTQIEQFLHMNMGMEFDLDMLKKMSTDYAKVKKQAIREAGEIVDVQNIQHISDDKELIGDAVEKITENWNTQRELFYKQTGLNQQSVGKELWNPNLHQQVGEDDEFSHELELQLCEDEDESELPKQENEEFNHEVELQLFSQQQEEHKE